VEQGFFDFCLIRLRLTPVRGSQGGDRHGRVAVASVAPTHPDAVPRCLAFGGPKRAPAEPEARCRSHGAIEWHQLVIAAWHSYARQVALDIKYAWASPPSPRLSSKGWGHQAFCCSVRIVGRDIHCDIIARCAQSSHELHRAMRGIARQRTHKVTRTYTHAHTHIQTDRCTHYTHSLWG
jgi:hypothetical protein